MPRSRATCAIGFPVSKTSSTAPRLKSSSNFRRVSAIAIPPQRRCLHATGANPGIHVGGHRVGDDAASVAVLGPVGDRVGQVLADDPVEVLAVCGAVQVTENIVQGTVLEQHYYNVIQGVGSIPCGHQRAS